MSNPQQKSIYDLKLHETSVVEDAFLFTVVLRVPGGWMYRSYDKAHQILTCCLVPFDNEFMGGPKPLTKSYGTIEAPFA